MISCRLNVTVVACIFLLLANKVNADCRVSHDLENGTWALIGLPCVPPEAENTAGEIFGSALGSSATYGVQWAVFAYDPGTRSYSDIGYDGAMQSGKGYWIVNQTGAAKSLVMPSGSRPVVPVTSAECPSASSACFEIPLAYSSARTGEDQFNIIGYPHFDSRRWADINVADNNHCGAANFTDPNPGTGCTLDEAGARNIFNTTGWAFNSAEYEEVSAASVLSPWQGLWVAILSGAQPNNNLRLLLPAVPVGTPAIYDVSGSILDGQQITITGSGFGTNGPNVVLFDDFNRGVDGELATLDATIGNWHGIDPNHPPYYGTDGQGNSTGYLIRDNSKGQFHIEFSDTQEIFISYRVMIPRGKHFPNSGAASIFPPGSQWKLTWLMDGVRGYSGNDDLVIPTWGNGTNFIIGGNDNAFQIDTGRPGSSTNWFSFLDWNRFSVYLKGGVNPDIDQGTVWSQGMSKEFGQKIFTANKVLFDGDDTPDSYQFEDDAISRWNRFSVPGWHRGGDDNTAAMYDDIYIATGAHARARIEIGDNANYDNCTVLAIVTPTSWQNNTIEATVRQGSFQSGETAYLFVVDENGNVSNGYPFAVGI